MTQISKILIAYDFSANAQRALAIATDLCRSHEASATLLHVWQPELFALPESFQLHDPAQLPEYSELLAHRLAAVAHELKSAGVMHVDTRLVQGAPVEQIVRVATEGGFDMIVMGTHGRTGLAHVLLGSVAEEVVRRAPCAVVTIRLGKEQREHAAEDARSSNG